MKKALAMAVCWRWLDVEKVEEQEMLKCPRLFITRDYLLPA